MSAEAAGAFIVLALIIIATGNAQPQNTENFSKMRKSDDLLIVWAVAHPSQEEMLADAELVFGGGRYSVLENGELLHGSGKGNTVRSIRAQGIAGGRALTIITE